MLCSVNPGVVIRETSQLFTLPQGHRSDHTWGIDHTLFNWGAPAQNGYREVSSRGFGHYGHLLPPYSGLNRTGRSPIDEAAGLQLCSECATLLDFGY